MSRFAHRLRSGKGRQSAYKRLRTASGAIAAVLGAAAATALFTPTPWAHGSAQVAIWIAAAVALVVCLVAILISTGRPEEPPIDRKSETSLNEAPQVVPIPGGHGSEGFMGASDAEVEHARRAGPGSPPTVSDEQAGRGPAS
jgi:hypothetical protein